jgi:hypothetical protein
MTMITITTDQALDALDETIGWRLRPGLDPDELFDAIELELHRRTGMPLSEISLLLADHRRRYAEHVRALEWRLLDAYQTMIGG